MSKILALLMYLATSASGAPQADKSPSARIIGGQDASIESFPYMVSVMLNDKHICGGALISNSLIVTAAHCIQGPASSYSVRAGDASTAGETTYVNKILIHQDYNAKTFDYDIALIELNGRVTVSTAKPVSMAEGSLPPAGSFANVTGWGITSEDGPMSPILQVARVPIVSQAACRSAYNDFPIQVTSRMFCAGNLTAGRQDTCLYDDGGPLVVDGLLTGIVSWGYGCARPNFPGVYTSIPSVREWIRYYTSI